AAGLKAKLAQGVEVYLARAAQPQLPQWLEELRTDAQVTQLDSSETAELLQQLRAKEKLLPGSAAAELLGGQRDSAQRSAAAAVEPAKPSETASAILEDRPEQSADKKQEQKTAEQSVDAAALDLQIAYLGLEESAPIEAVVNRSNARQYRLGAPTEGGRSSQGVAAAEESQLQRNAKRDQRTGFESNLSQLRSQAYPQPSQSSQRTSDEGPLRSAQSAGAQAAEPQAGLAGGGGGRAAAASSERRENSFSQEPGQTARQILIIVRPQ
ncbi:MAG: hypothetical protein ACK48X_15475, partial [Planctomycetota bacterium]